MEAARRTWNSRLRWCPCESPFLCGRVRAARRIPSYHPGRAEKGRSSARVHRRDEVHSGLAVAVTGSAGWGGSGLRPLMTPRSRASIARSGRRLAVGLSDVPGGVVAVDNSGSVAYPVGRSIAIHRCAPRDADRGQSARAAQAEVRAGGMDACGVLAHTCCHAALMPAKCACPRRGAKCATSRPWRLAQTSGGWPWPRP